MLVMQCTYQRSCRHGPHYVPICHVSFVPSIHHAQKADLTITDFEAKPHYIIISRSWCSRSILLSPTAMSGLPPDAGPRAYALSDCERVNCVKGLTSSIQPRVGRELLWAQPGQNELKFGCALRSGGSIFAHFVLQRPPGRPTGLLASSKLCQRVKVEVHPGSTFT
jgi:hypothetical protein